MNVVSDDSFRLEEATIKLRMDVDYAYPSRLKSFFYTIFCFKAGKGYLKNSKIIAQMINESKKNVKAYWFFTPKTIPDNELLELLNETKHEVALHVATNPYRELELLQQATKRRISFYTVHGTERLLARLLWRRKLTEAKALIPLDFPLKSFYVFPTVGIDALCYDNPPKRVLEIAKQHIAEGDVLHFHPVWLFQQGTINRRGAFYGVLKKILGTNEELATIVVRKKVFFKIARDTGEYERDIIPADIFLTQLADRGVDVFTFIERKWCSTIPNPPKSWIKTEDNIALLNVTTYADWLKLIGKKTRNMIRKAEKTGIQIQIAQPSEKLAEDIWKIYHETPLRQGRAFLHYEISLDAVRANVFSSAGNTFIAAHYQEELAGFIQMVYGDRIALISQILALRKHSDKAVNNALIAKAVEICSAKQIEWLMYGRIGNHPSLDTFKRNNGFEKFQLPRYYVPITGKGRLAIRLGLHRELKDAVPQSIKPVLIPVFNWVSRTKQQLKILSSSTRQSRLLDEDE